MNSLNIAIDFSGTWNRDHETFMVVSELLQDHGHNVFIVTNRKPRQKGFVEEKVLQAHIEPSQVYFAGLTPKRQYMRNEGIEIDIWIDDEPESVFGLTNL